jgi:hypothetical protein
LSNNNDETAESPEVVSNSEETEEQWAVIAGPGKDTGPDPKAAAKEKRRRKWQAAKAAAAAAKIKSVTVVNVLEDDVTMVEANLTISKEVETTPTSKVIAKDETFTLVAPRWGQPARKSSLPS